MAKAPRYTSEGKLPAHPLAPTAGPYEISQLTAVSGEMARLGEGVAGLGGQMMNMDTRKAQEIKEAAEYAQRINILSKQHIFDSNFEANLDKEKPEGWLDTYQQQVSTRDTDLLGSISDPQQRTIIGAQLEATRTEMRARLSHLQQARLNEIRINELDNATSNLLADLRFDEAYSQITGAFHDGRGFISAAKHQDLLEDYATDYFMSYGYEEGSKMLMARGKGKGFTNVPELRTDGRNRVQNRMDSYASGRRKQAETQKYDILIANYKDFSRKLPRGELTYDDIERAGFDKDATKLWQQIAEGSFAPAPSSSTYGGVSKIVDDIMAFNTLEISKKDAYNRILIARFIDKSITDDDYIWALGRIENPYPKHVAQNTKAIMDATEKYYKETGWFFGTDWIDKQEKQLLTARKKAFLSWLDGEIEAGKYPGGKDMYAKMKEMEVLIAEPDTAPGGMYGHSASPLDPNSPLYITTDEKADKVPEGTAYYDGLTGQWRYKPKKEQAVAEEPEGLGKQIFSLENII